MRAKLLSIWIAATVFGGAVLFVSSPRAFSLDEPPSQSSTSSPSYTTGAEPATGAGASEAVGEGSHESTQNQIYVSATVEKPAGIATSVYPTGDGSNVRFSEDVLYLGLLNPETTPAAEASFLVQLSGSGLFSEQISWTDLVGRPGTDAEGRRISSARLAVYRKIGPPQPIWEQIPNGWKQELQLDGTNTQHFKTLFATDWTDCAGAYSGSLEVSLEQR